MAAEHWSTKLLEEALRNKNKERSRGAAPSQRRRPQAPCKRGRGLPARCREASRGQRKRAKLSGGGSTLKRSSRAPTSAWNTTRWSHEAATNTRGRPLRVDRAGRSTQAGLPHCERPRRDARDPLLVPFARLWGRIGVTLYMPLGLADVFVRIHNATARTLFQPNVSAADRAAPQRSQHPIRSSPGSRLAATGWAAPRLMRLAAGASQPRRRVPRPCSPRDARLADGQRRVRRGGVPSGRLEYSGRPRRMEGARDSVQVGFRRNSVR